LAAAATATSAAAAAAVVVVLAAAGLAVREAAETTAADAATRGVVTREAAAVGIREAARGQAEVVAGRGRAAGAPVVLEVDAAADREGADKVREREERADPAEAEAPVEAAGHSAAVVGPAPAAGEAKSPEEDRGAVRAAAVAGATTVPA
jgi:hypothetical protein